MSTTGSTQFTLRVKDSTFTGRHNAAAAQEGIDLPLVVAIHGGGYTSAYFDVPGYSLLDRGASVGVPVIAVDRPAHGGSDPVEPADSVLTANAAALDHLIAELWARHGAGKAGVFVVGHSIGAAITLAIAARHPTWPLLGVATSGCLLRSPEGQAGWFASIPTETFPIPDEDKAGLMFGPEGTYRADMPQAAYFANVPVRVAELVAISSQWEPLYRDIAPKITVPVHVRQGQFDRLWVTDDAQVAEFAAALTGSPLVDAAPFRSSGHAIDLHRGSAAFQLEQLAFALAVSARLVTS